MNSLVVIFVSTIILLILLSIILLIKCKTKAKKITEETFANMKAPAHLPNNEKTDNPDETSEETSDEIPDEETEVKSILKNENSPPSDKSVSFKEFDVMNIGKTNSSAYGTIETYNKYDPKYNNVFETSF